MTKRTNTTKETHITLEPVHVPLKKDDLLFRKSFIDRLGGKKNARILLLDIIDRYFRSKFFDPGLLEDLEIKLRNPGRYLD